MHAVPRLEQQPKSFNADINELARRAIASEHGTEEFDRTITQLFESCKQLITSIARGRGCPEKDVNDIVQEVNIRILLNLHTVRSPNFFQTWLYRVTVNFIAGYWRKNKHVCLFSEIPARINTGNGNHRTQNFISHLPEPSNHEHQLMVKMLWEKMLETLNKKEQTMIQLHHGDKLPCQELAGLIGKSTSATKTAMHRLRKKLRHIAEQLDSESAIEMRNQYKCSRSS